MRSTPILSLWLSVTVVCKNKSQAKSSSQCQHNISSNLCISSQNHLSEVLWLAACIRDQNKKYSLPFKQIRQLINGKLTNLGLRHLSKLWQTILYPSGSPVKDRWYVCKDYRQITSLLGWNTFVLLFPESLMVFSNACTAACYIRLGSEWLCWQHHLSEIFLIAA